MTLFLLIFAAGSLGCIVGFIIGVFCERVTNPFIEEGPREMEESDD